MKVLIAAGIFPPEPGGPATYAKIVSEMLPKQGIAVGVLPFREARVYPKGIRHLAYLIMLLRRAYGADVIFAQDAVSVGFPARIVAKILNKRFVLRVGGDYAWEQGVQRFDVKENLDEFVSSRQYRLPVLILQKIQSWVARGATHVIVPSEYLKCIVRTWGVEKNRIVVVYSAFVPESIREEKNNLKKSLGMAAPVIVSSARLVPWKGMRELIGLLPELKKEFPKISLYIIGDGPERNNLEKTARKLDVAGRVQFLGTLSRIAVLKYIKAGDVFVLNSGYEGLSYTLLEAMAMGTPIVTTDVGGNSELIENEKEGILVQYDNKIELLTAVRRILNGSLDGQGFARTAQEKVKQFSEQRMVDGTISVLKQV